MIVGFGFAGGTANVSPGLQHRAFGHDCRVVLLSLIFFCYAPWSNLESLRMAVGQIPHGIIIQKVAPRIWLPSMVVIWAALTVSRLASYVSVDKEEEEEEEEERSQDSVSDIGCVSDLYRRWLVRP
jgi:hypothetical protein